MFEQSLVSKHFCLLVILALAALFLSGCGAMGVKERPQVSLANVGLESIGLFEQRLALSLRVQNPNGSDMEIRGLSCTLDINGQRFAQGGSSKPVTVPAYGDMLMKVNANAGTGSVLRQIQSLAVGGREAIDYRLQGRADVNGLGLVPFDQVGDIPLMSLLGQPAQPGHKF
ncbi:MAG: LEA type 2 family protein [Desulfobulbaceae bacterium]|nr:LEA type 2 family protein [Desulfobulbaceae bacterium]